MGVTTIAVTHARPVDRNQNIPERAGLHSQLRCSPSVSCPESGVGLRFGEDSTLSIGYFAAGGGTISASRASLHRRLNSSSLYTLARLR